MGIRSFLEAPPGIGPGIRVLQTRALPLGHGAVTYLLIISKSTPFVKRFLGFFENVFSRTNRLWEIDFRRRVMLLAMISREIIVQHRSESHPFRSEKHFYQKPGKTVGTGEEFYITYYV